METGKKKIDAVPSNEPNVLNDEPQVVTDESSDLSSDIARLQEELASERDARLRLAAEYDNYRRRTRLESERAADEGKRELLEQMLSIIDELDLALANSNDAEGWVAEWVPTIHRRFLSVLEANGVVVIQSVGQKFDPEFHEAFEVRSGTEYEPGTVHTELRRGYLWNGKLLRPALVVVAQ